MPAELVIKAVDVALERRGYPQGVIHHSDQGSQYTSKAFKDRCQQAGVRVSMGSITRRRHGRLGHLSPVQYEAAMAG